MSTLTEVPATCPAIERDGVGRRYLQAALYSGVGGVASRVLQGLTPLVLARYLGPKEYGVYALVISLVGIVTGVSHLGQSAALQKFLPEYFVKAPSRGGAILADSLILTSGTMAIVCTGFFLLSRWIASAIYRNPSLTSVFQFCAILVLSLTLFNLASSVVAGMLDFKAYSRALVVRSAVSLGLAWLGVVLFGLYGALAGQLLASLLGLALLAASGLRLTRMRFPGVVRPVFSRTILAEIFAFAVPALLAGMLVSPAYWWANTLLARHAGFEEVGLFGAAFALAQLIMLIPSTLSVPAVSFLSEAYATSDQQQFGKLVSGNLRVMWAVTLPLCLGCALASGSVVQLALGAHYKGAAELALWMSFTALFIVVSSSIGVAIASLGRMWEGFALNIIWLAMFFGLACWWIPVRGGHGLAAAYFVSYLIFGVVVWYYSERCLRICYRGVRRIALLTVGAMGMTALGTHPGIRISACVRAVLVLGLIGVEWKWILDENERNLARQTLACLPWKG